MSTPLHVVWFRHDLRLADHPALTAAAEGGAVLPVVVDTPSDDEWAPGAAARWWRDRSLALLESRLRARGGRLIRRRGPAPDVLADLAVATGAVAVHWHRRYEPAAQREQDAVRAGLEASGIEVDERNGSLLAEPRELATAGGAPYRVFTPFWRRFQEEIAVPRPLPEPTRIAWPERWPTSEGWGGAVDEAPSWQLWNPGEDAARERLMEFCRRLLDDYPQSRDRPDADGTSRLSPYLHHGDISVREVWHAVDAATGVPMAARRAFQRQLAWREFGYHLLHHFPKTPVEPLYSKYAGFPWTDDAAALAAWQEGRTGYPIVDAGMRQLRETGWMHNRIRMIVASFLVKDLLLPWQAGARWFWERLVDADLANNTLGWQWAAGCGADAAPYFRIFNPVKQGERHDPAGNYVRDWLPELRAVPETQVHQPRPDAIVDHARARERALAAYARLRSN